MKVEVKLIPPDKEGKIPVKYGDTIFWILGVPYKLIVGVVES